MARHSLRSALRTLQGEGIVQIEPNRGARVKSLSPEDVRGLSELRIALEVEAARMALERDGGTLPASVHRAARAAGGARAAARGPSWGAVAEAHEALHHEIVLAADSPRLAAAHRLAGAELRLFVLQLPPTVDARSGSRSDHAGSSWSGWSQRAPRRPAPAHRGIDRRRRLLG